MSAAESPFDLQAALAFHRASLVRFVEHGARGLLRHESAEDLVQGIHVRALRAAREYRHRSEQEFLAWLATLARRHVADRHAHFAALRRSAGSLLRIGRGDAGQSSAPGAAPASPSIGPATFAVRREQVEVAMRVLAELPERTRELIDWEAQGLDLPEIARRLGLGYEAAKKARQRALEQFREEALRAGLG